MNAIKLAMVALFAVAPIFAQITVLKSSDSGWYSSAGYHDPDNSSYFTGYNPDIGHLRSFFVFDSSSIGPGTITAGTLRLFNPEGGFESPTSSEQFSLYSLGGSLADLKSGLGGTPAFDSLGQGTLWGAATLTPSSNGTWVEIQLNSLFLDFINLTPGEFAFGGAITTLSGDPDASEYAFGFSNDPDIKPELLLTMAGGSTAVPEPATTSLIGAALLTGLAAIRWRLRRQTIIPTLT